MKLIENVESAIRFLGVLWLKSLCTIYLVHLLVVHSVGPVWVFVCISLSTDNHNCFGVN